MTLTTYIDMFSMKIFKKSIKTIYLHMMSLANDSQAAIILKAPNVTRCKPALAIYDMKINSSLLSIIVIANSNIASTQPDFTTSKRLISCSVFTCTSHTTNNKI